MAPHVAPLIAALRQICTAVTCDELAPIVGVSRATAARMEADLTAAEPTAARWNGEHLSRLAAWEAQTQSTALLAEALRGAAPADTGPDLEEIRRLQEAVEAAGRCVAAMGAAMQDGRLDKAEARALVEQGGDAVRALNRVVRAARRRLEG